MSAPFRDLTLRVGSIAAPDFDVDDLIKKGEARLRLRRAAAVVGTTVVVALAVFAAAAVTPPDDRSTIPISPPVPSGYTSLPDTGGAVAMEPGRYGLIPIGPIARPLAVVAVPDGFTDGGPFLFPFDEQTGLGDECCIVGYWTVAYVNQDPCKARVSPDPGPSVQDLADALTAQRRTTSTKPTPVTLGGYDGLYMELTAPASLDFSTCRGEDLSYWESDPGTRHFDASHYDPSKGLPVERIWIIDVDGQRVVLSIGVDSGVDDQQAQPLIDIVESTQFVK